MSSADVRAAFRARVATLLPGFIYVESFNVAEPSKDLPARFFSLDFAAASDERIGLGRPSWFRESGAVGVLVNTEQMIGDTEATTAADVVRRALCNWADLGGHLRVLDCSPPADIDGGDMAGAWYRLSVSARYQFDHVEN